MQLHGQVIDQQGFVIAIFGVKDQGSGIGVVWMLSSQKLEAVKTTFIKMTPQIRTLCFEEYKKLFNYVYKKNLPAIKYLQYVGANFC